MNDLSATPARSYRIGGLPAKMRKAALEVMENGDDVSLREVCRNVGASVTATYHHFKNKEALIADVMAQGFRDLSDQISIIPVPSHRRSYYLLFAAQHPGLFRAMFGPILRERWRHPGLLVAFEAFEALYACDIFPETHGQAALALAGVGTAREHADG